MFQFEQLRALFCGLSLLKPRGDGSEQNVDKICRSYYFFLETFMNECSSCYFCS